MTVETISARLDAFRTELQRLTLDGWLVPMADEFQSEYVPASAQRIAFLSGFTGSAGLIIVLADKAAFFTDSRYTLQASQQIPDGLFAVYDSAMKTPSDWLKENTKAGTRLGFDPWLHSVEQIERLTDLLKKQGVELLSVETNPVDRIWRDRPAASTAPIYSYELAYAGKSSAEKRQQIADALRAEAVQAAVITDPACIAWLLNIRGDDVPNTPLPLSYAIIHDDAVVDWFVDQRKVPQQLSQSLGTQTVCHPISGFVAALRQLGERKTKVRLDPASAIFHVAEQLHLSGAVVSRGADPCVLPKACKNSVELDGTRAAHRRDGAALSQFLAWLDAAMARGQDVTELDAEEKLRSFRSSHNLYRGASFDTIAGAGAHGAIVHYRANQQTNQKLELGSFFLLDSGAQYLDGTTDVTRTIPVGTVGALLKDRFTRVLKGHIALASIRFPVGTTGSELDVLARQYLWSVGLDYGHGTGHGVGHFLGVHEGPQSISCRSKVALQAGMIVSNEPGYYENNHYGIRIENLQVVVELPEISTPNRKMLGFETLTLAPVDRRAIAVDLLTQPERDWLNAYHSRVCEVLRPQIVDTEALAWLVEATAPI